MNRQRQSLNACLHPVALPFVSGSRLPLFRCGKCAGCLKHKGAELAVRLYRESLASSCDVYFLTFTYKNDLVPIREYDIEVDHLTGEVVSQSKSRWSSVNSSWWHSHCPGEYRRNKRGRRCKRCFPLLKQVGLSYDGLPIIRSYYWSLRVKDIQDAFKRFRASSGLFSNSWKYCLVPEYGSVTYRPHYHCLLVGLSHQQVDLLVSEWTLGSVDVRRVSSRGSDRSQQLSKLSAYLSKYASKGSFDCPFIKSGDCLPPRRGISCRFGFGSKDMYESLKRHLLAFDVFGEYDYKSIDPSPDMVKVLSGRQFVYVNETPYPLPELFKREFFKKSFDVLKTFSYSVNGFLKRKLLLDDKGKEIKERHYLSTPLRRKVAVSLLDRFVQDFKDQSRELFKSAEDLSASPLELLSVVEHDREVRSETIERAFSSSLEESLY